MGGAEARDCLMEGAECLKREALQQMPIRHLPVIKRVVSRDLHVLCLLTAAVHLNHLPSAVEAMAEKMGHSPATCPASLCRRRRRSASALPPPFRRICILSRRALKDRPQTVRARLQLSAFAPPRVTKSEQGETKSHIQLPCGRLLLSCRTLKRAPAVTPDAASSPDGASGRMT